MELKGKGPSGYADDDPPSPFGGRLSSKSGYDEFGQQLSSLVAINVFFLFFFFCCFSDSAR
jgi:hypothetical protein